MEEVNHSDSTFLTDSILATYSPILTSLSTSRLITGYLTHRAAHSAWKGHCVSHVQRYVDWRHKVSLGSPSHLSLEEKPNENWRVEFACQATPLFIWQRDRPAIAQVQYCSFLTPHDGHDRCLTCLGHKHAKTAFVDGSGPHCECIPIANLRSWLSFIMKLPLHFTQSSPTGCKNPGTALVRDKGDLRFTVRNRRASPHRSPAPHSVALLIFQMLARQPACSSRSGPSVSFGALEEDKMSIAASEEGLLSAKAEYSAKQPPAAGAAQSKSKAKPCSSRRPRPLDLEVDSPPSPKRSRLNDWFLGSRRDSQPCSLPVPFFPQVEHVVGVHLCPQNTATWRFMPPVQSL
ncbi:Terpentetriene synthase [Labeo rohita]|uniref:Terpentetriene synthase n=1 Tax=Labeo rohita TaxID=84645 RepID=A0ABQ8LTF4_LABRO|nr:Terpentetriene synthase [Labeo rohita]